MGRIAYAVFYGESEQDGVVSELEKKKIVQVVRGTGVVLVARYNVNKGNLKKLLAKEVK